jgi:predicted dehydrogenase
MTHPESTVTWVCDSDAARLKLMKDRYPGIKTTANAQELVSAGDVDAVAVCTPTATHFELTKSCLEAGKHVFVEKPLARTPEECDKLIALADKRERVLFVGHVFVYNAGIQAVRKYIRGGELGRIHYIHVTRTNLGPVRSDVSALWDLAPHDISILNYWFDALPQRVSAIGGRYLNSKVEDVAFATYTFPDNMIANIHVSWLNPKKVREIVLVGEKKMLLWTDMDLTNPVQIYDKKVTIDQGTEGVVDSFMAFRASIHEGDTLIPKIHLNEPLSAECAAFLKAVRDPSTSLSTGVHGRNVVAALAAADQSMHERGREIEIA